MTPEITFGRWRASLARRVTTRSSEPREIGGARRRRGQARGGKQRLNGGAWGRSCTWSVTNSEWQRGSGDHPSRRFASGSPDLKRLGRTATTRRVAVLRLRRTRPRRRGNLRSKDDLVLRDQRTRCPRLLPPLARRPKPRRHHHHRLEPGAAGGHSLRRVPLPGRIDGREDGRTETRHPLRPVGAHGSCNRRTAT